jgi:predicted glycogen debranching enzyme
MATSRKSPILIKESELAAPLGQAKLAFGREICGSLDIAEQREWLVTNGIGGFASGTVSGNLTRRYHGLLIAALHPPVGRTQLVAKLDETVHYAGIEYPLATNRWLSGAVEPKGYLNIESFRLEGITPIWQFALGEALVEKRIWMSQGENTTYVQYTLLRGGQPLELKLKALVNYRDFHSSTHAGDWQMKVEPVEKGVQINAFDGATPFYLLSAEAEFETRHEWHRACFLPQERYRGLDDHEDHLLAALFSTELALNQSVTLVLTTNADAQLDRSQAWEEYAEHEKKLFAKWASHDAQGASSAPDWVQQLILAADQFIVKRRLPEETDGRSIIAGYHWFADWGRDTMIALPGLTLTTGRADIARKILLAFARCVDRGRLPNDFPDAGGRPAYNTVDAALWFFEAVRHYFAATQDTATLVKLFPILEEIIKAHLKGTRYQIHVDEADGLLYAGEPSVQLTWMDAKVGDWVVTPRIGKPVEINALWYNALGTMTALASSAGSLGEPFANMAAMVKWSFGKFWNSALGCCYDVIDSPGIGNDASLRPNQIFAVSLPKSPLTPEQQRAVVDVCARRLVTSHGLRSLAQEEPGYQGHYGGAPRDRDGAYHQGTVWGWLLGPFVLAHLRVYQDRKAALSFLEPLGKQITSHGLGTLSEIFDGDAPFTPRGCVAQAWTVGEALRAWRAILG